jgi:hypothetical protein
VIDDVAADRIPDGDPRNAQAIADQIDEPPRKENVDEWPAPRTQSRTTGELDRSSREDNRHRGFEFIPLEALEPVLLHSSPSGVKSQPRRRTLRSASNSTSRFVTMVVSVGPPLTEALADC